MPSLTIKLPPELKARVEADARHSGKSISAVVREALLAQSRPARKTSLHERNQDLCGAGDSGIPDLASHPRHLESFGR